MPSTHRTSRLLPGLLIAGLTALVVGLPFLCLASSGQSSAILLTQCEDAEGCETDGFDTDFWELFALPPNFHVLTPPAAAYRVADDLAETESALADAHLQRGPPLN